MKIAFARSLTAAVIASAMLSGSALADSYDIYGGYGGYYEVTVTNITKGMTFTPIMVATTRRGDQFFELGEPASDAVEAMAEAGDVGPLQDSLDALDISNSSFLPFLAPGESVTQLVATNRRYRNVSIAAMLVPSNDIFFAANGVPGPRGRRTLTFTVPAYDAGTELNDELCASLPGPGCGPDPGPASSNGEGYVYISNGIRGIGDLDADQLDFKNPVALISIKRLGRHDRDDD